MVQKFNNDNLIFKRMEKQLYILIDFTCVEEQKLEDTLTMIDLK
jgi:hypothetical protein